MAPKTDVIAEPRETIAAQAAEIERLTKINAEICSKSNWYVVENARFEEKLTDSQHKVKVLTDTIDNLVQQKGRHNTEIAYKRLVEAIANVKGLDK